jgi:hypothetical protein
MTLTFDLTQPAELVRLLLAAGVWVLGAWQVAGWSLSACQWLLKGSALADPASSCTSSLPGKGDSGGSLREQAHGYRSSQGRVLSSPPPASSSSDLESLAVVPITLASIDPSPNLSAFSAGIELAIFTALLTISSFLVVSWIVKTMRSSNK